MPKPYPAEFRPWRHRRPRFRDPGDEAADASTRAGKRSAAPRCGGSLADEPVKKLMYSLVRELAATDAPIRVPVAVTCRILGFSKQAFHHWLREQVSDRTWDEAHLINAAYDIHADDPAFGYRSIAEQGFTVSKRRVWRLCSQHKLWSIFAKRRGRRRKAGPPVHDDHAATVHRTTIKPVVAQGYHRTPHGHREVVPVRDQGRIFQPNRRIFHRFTDESLTRGLSAADVDQPTRI